MHVMGAESTLPQAFGHRKLLCSPSLAWAPGTLPGGGSKGSTKWPDGSRTTMSICNCLPLLPPPLLASGVLSAPD